MLIFYQIQFRIEVCKLFFAMKRLYPRCQIWVYLLYLFEIKVIKALKR